MSALPRPGDAPAAFRTVYAEDTYSLALQKAPGAPSTEPPPDIRLTPAWKVRGRLTASDAVLGKGPLALGGRTAWYAWVLESAVNAGQFAIDLRGTIGLPEWLKDAEFGSRLHPVAGCVEVGFDDIYRSMGLNGAVGNAAADVAELLKDAESVTVTGHSLGGALTNLLAFDLAAPDRLGRRIHAVIFASPRPGDLAFGDALRARIPDNYYSYAYELDLVPRVPFGFGFSPVPGTIELSAIHPAICVKCSLDCNHHALSYASLLDPTSLASFPAIAIDLPFLKCITLSPRPAPASSSD